MISKGERTIENIVNIAIAEFAINGYVGASISKIAKKSGLSKSSLYSHFESKEELFKVCLRIAAERRLSFFNSFIEDHMQESTEDILYKFLLLYDDLGNEGSDAYFHERFAYFPPEDLKEVTTEFTTNVIIVQVQKMLEPVFRKWAGEYNISDKNMENALISFLSIYDGIIIERLIGSREKYLYRLKHTWPFYENAIKSYEKD